MSIEKELERNLKRFRRWLCENAVSRVINGFLPTFLDDKTKKIQVVVNDGMQPCTDGKTIWVSLLPGFLEDGWTFKDWLIALKAATAHEAQHINSSNFVDIEEIREWYGKYLADQYGLDPSIGGTIVADAQNIVEDGRIERIAVQRRPGMLVPFRMLNDVIRDGQLIKGKSDDGAGEYEDFWKNVLSYSKTGLYAPGCDVYAGTRMETNFLGIQSLIDDAIASDSSSECRDLVQEMMEDISPYLVDLIKSDPKLEEALKQKEVKPEYTSNEGTPEQSNPSAPQNNPLRKASPGGNPQKGQQPQSGQDGNKKEEEKGNADKGGDDGEQPGKDGSEKETPSDSGDSGQEGPSPSGDDASQEKDSSNQTGFSNSDQRMDPLDPDALDELRKQMERELNSANQAENTSKNQTDPDSLSLQDIESIRAEYTGNTLPVRYESLEIPYISEIPADLKAQALTLRREITRIREARSKERKGLRRGTLDTGALWKTGLQEDAIFTRKGNKDAGSVAFYLLIDNSGSTIDFASKKIPGLRKYQAARSAAAVVEEAVRGIAPCKIALFDQSSKTVNHNVIKGWFDEKKSGNCSWNSLTAIGPGGCNKDSVNIRIAAMELSRRPERKKALLLLSDGLPSAYGSRSEAYAEVRQAVLAARRKGIIVIPIMFGEEGFLTSSLKSYELMYEKHIIACEPKEITPRLCNLFRQIICR